MKCQCVHSSPVDRKRRLLALFSVKALEKRVGSCRHDGGRTAGGSNRTEPYGDQADRKNQRDERCRFITAILLN